MTFDEYIGKHFTDGEEVAAVVRIEPHHCNSTGNMNGGVFLSMADNVSTGAINPAYFEKTGARKELPARAQVADWARKNPTDAANVIKSWMR